jgi:hypothetical protein
VPRAVPRAGLCRASAVLCRESAVKSVTTLNGVCLIVPAALLRYQRDFRQPSHHSAAGAGLRCRALPAVRWKRLKLRGHDGQVTVILLGLNGGNFTMD